MKTVLRFAGKAALSVVALVLMGAFAVRAASVIDLQEGSVTSIERSYSRPDRKTRRTAADEALMGRVRAVLQKEETIRVDAEYGTVTLCGRVANVRERQDIIDRVQALEGVLRVKSDLRVKGEYDERTRTRGLEK